MKRSLGMQLWLFLVLSIFNGGAAALAAKPNGEFVFRDVGDEAGLFPHLAGIMGHGAGWGDVDGDGWVDLYVGTFLKKDAGPNLFFRNREGKFTLDGQENLRLAARTTGTLMVDLDNDGDLDLYVSSMPHPSANLIGCRLFRNDGQGQFTDISSGNAACPAAFGGRSATTLDYDGDGLLDLLVGEEPMLGYNGSQTKSSRLFHNLGKLQFEDVTQSVGIAAGIPGLGVAAGDLNNDSWPDIFIAAHQGGNALFLNDGHGKFQEMPNSRELFAWKGSGGDNMIAGVSFGDVNRDGLLDIVIGQHYDTPWQKPVTIRLYLNRGIKDGIPSFEDVTQSVELTPLSLKAPHVEIQDFDNDGWPDIYASLVMFADGQPHPLIFKNLGSTAGLPRFRADALTVNDFPTTDDKSVKRTGEFFKKMVEDKKVTYMAAGPSADFDNDGKLDVFLASWWPELRSLLLHNETPGGHWLQIQVQGAKDVNRMGIGTRINVYSAGKLGEAKALLGCKEIGSGYGYASAQPAIAHFGLGAVDEVDLEITLPHGKGKREQRGIKADQRITVE